ncbi:MAG: hypothetical protein WCE30_21835 [Mycobacterium sp.]
MFFDFRDSDGTPLSKYRVFYTNLLSFNATRTASNAAAMFVYNQVDTWLASVALGVLSLMSSTGTVLSALGDVYHRVFGKAMEVVPPAAVMSLALLGYVAWAFVDRRANVRSLAEDRHRIAVAVVLAIGFSWLLRNPFYLMDRALNFIPSLVVDFLNGTDAQVSPGGQAKGSGVSGYLMDSVVRPVTQSLMYGHPLTGSCVHEFSAAMDRGNAPACAPALVEAAQGATFAAVALGAFFWVLAVYGLVMLAMFVYHTTLAVGTWFSVLYFMGKALFDVKAFVMPSRMILVAAGHTLAAGVIDVFAIVGPAVSIAIVNSMTQGEPTFSVVLYIPAVLLLFFISRQAIGAIVRKTGAVHGNPGSILNRIMAPRPMFGAEAAVRRRETAAGVASLTSRAAAAVSPFFPGASVLAAGAAAVEGRLRSGGAGSSSQRGDGSGMPALSETDRETVDGAMDVIVVGSPKERTTQKVTWPEAPAPPASPERPVAASPLNNGVETFTAPTQVRSEQLPPPDQGRHHAEVVNGVDVGSPVAFGGFGPHRLPPEEQRQPSAAVSGDDHSGARAMGDAASWMRERARDVAARSASLFSGMGSGTAGEDSGGDGRSADDLIVPMVRSYGPAGARVQASARPGSVIAPHGREEVRRSAVDASRRERARYVLAASGQNVIPVPADGDAGMRVYMYNDGTRNVVDPAEGEYVMGQRF